MSTVGHVGTAARHAARRLVSAAAARVLFEFREWRRKPAPPRYRRFVILAPGRSGSQMLVQRCNSHLNAQCFGELLSPEAIYWGPSIWRPAHGKARRARDRDPIDFLDRHLWHGYRKVTAAVGFKMLYAHLLGRSEQLRPLFTPEAELAVLWLERRNSFEVYLSELHAQRTKTFHAYDGASVPTIAPLEIDPKACHRSLVVMQLQREAVGRIIAPLNVLKLYYEDLVTSPAKSDARICSFLGLPVAPLIHSTQKFAKGRLSERISNLPELKDYFAGTEWAEFLDEPIREPRSGAGE